MDTTRCKITISPWLNNNDRELLLNLFTNGPHYAELTVDSGEYSITGNFSHDAYSAFCILEDFDLLNIEQL